MRHCWLHQLLTTIVRTNLVEFLGFQCSSGFYTDLMIHFSGQLLYFICSQCSKIWLTPYSAQVLILVAIQFLQQILNSIFVYTSRNLFNLEYKIRYSNSFMSLDSYNLYYSKYGNISMIQFVSLGHPSLHHINQTPLDKLGGKNT